MGRGKDDNLKSKLSGLGCVSPPVERDRLCSDRPAPPLNNQRLSLSLQPPSTGESSEVVSKLREEIKILNQKIKERLKLDNKSCLDLKSKINQLQQNISIKEQELNNYKDDILKLKSIRVGLVKKISKLQRILSSTSNINNQIKTEILKLKSEKKAIKKSIDDLDLAQSGIISDKINRLNKQQLELDKRELKVNKLEHDFHLKLNKLELDRENLNKIKDKHMQSVFNFNCFIDNKMSEIKQIEDQISKEKSKLHQDLSNFEKDKSEFLLSKAKFRREYLEFLDENRRR